MHSDITAQFAPGDQPDKILYEKATLEIKHSRYDVGRLTLQTLINTYPDSEFLSKAKLEIADSYYSEGGVSGLTQAEAEYKDFITFFPTAPEAPEAQYRVAMSHFRMMAKADRDQTEAKLAEAEFKEFLLKYPDSPILSRVKRRLRETQEVLAEGEYYTANFYYTHQAYPAARSRFEEITNKYPDYSGGDNALYYLGQSLEQLKRGREAIPYYSRVMTDFPLSPLVPQAKARLAAMHQPIPRPTRAMLARARADAAHHPDRDLLSKVGGVFSSTPNTNATLFGPVHVGGPPAGEAQMAKAPPVGGPETGKAAIVVQPVGESSLTAGKPVDVKASAPDSNAKAKESAPNNPPSDSTTPAEPAKKKGRFTRLKKIL